MNPLDSPDSHHLKAAIGWLELGDHGEANAELENIAPQNRVHPDVLEIRWHVCATAKKWDVCLNIANAQISATSESASGYIHRSYSLRRVENGGLQRAYDALFEVQDKFPKESIIRYNLACYQAQLGNIELARSWLQEAFELGDTKALKAMALDDSDLEPLWREIPKWKIPD